jgi:U3 small nucleolar RNA-associated protein 13
VSYTGSPEVDRVISTLPDLDLVRLLKMVRDWNANARTSPVAQGILHCILRLRSAEQIVQAFERVQGVKNAFAVDGEDGENAKEAGAEDAGEGDEAARKRPRKQEVLPALNELLEGLIPYAQRHFTRIDKLVQDSYALDYLVGEMDGGVFGAELLEV